MEGFFHGVRVLDVDTGPRPIRTVRSSVIGLIGTAPEAMSAIAAFTTVGRASNATEILFTAQSAGFAGNTLTIAMVLGDGANANAGVSVDGQAITITMATDGDGAAASTAAEVVNLVNADNGASALVAAELTAGHDGSGISRAIFQTGLTGGADEPFPLYTWVLIAGQRSAGAGLGKVGTLVSGIDGIMDQVGAVVAVMRVPEGNDEAATVANVVSAVQQLPAAESAVKFAPRLLCAPGWTHQRLDGYANPVIAEMNGLLSRMRAVAIADGPNTTDNAAMEYREDWGSRRIFVVDPWVKVQASDGLIVTEQSSARVSGLIAKVDNDQGFWVSPSNNEIAGIVGIARPVDFSNGDANSSANLLNEQEVATIIRRNGFRLWGNRTCSADPKWAFLNVVRTADIIADSLQDAHMWAVDRNITRTYMEDVPEGVNAFLSTLVNQGAILGGKCWADPDLNSPANLADGRVFFNFDFTPPAPAENVTFRSHMVDDYYEELV